ncbi:MAG: tRNA lysidine(34) synthetase TilS [Clostridiales bacterium]|nr:tRNA lysidine(34) synthetase TilS [Clostridiales bacterium]
MDEAEQRVRRTIEEYHMLDPGDRVIAAVSGGADSVCLLTLLCGMKKDWDLKLMAVHVHHGLRGPEADRDADFVRALCEELEVTCHIIKVDVRKYASENGMSEEEAGRYLRYEALEREARWWEDSDGCGGEDRDCDGGRRRRDGEGRDCDGGRQRRDGEGRDCDSGRQRCGGETGDCRNKRVKIAVAHHSDDQAETILHNLFRGSGLGGLKGISYVRGRIIRPLLDIGRRDIVEWLEENGCAWVQDSTNSSGHYTRNRIRSNLLPLIEAEVNQGAAGNILRMGKLASQADEYLRAQGECWIKGHVVRDGPEHFLIPCDLLQAEPEIIRSYVVMELLKRLAGSARDLGLIHVQQVLALAGRPVGKEVDLPYSLMARREYREISVGRSILQEKDKEVCLPQVRMCVFPYKKGSQFPKNMYTKWFDCDRIEGTPVVRTRRPGDYITLADGSHKALKRFMIDEKIPRQLRDQVPLLTDGSHVMWIIGYRISEFYKIGPDTTKVLQAEAGGRRKE